MKGIIRIIPLLFAGAMVLAGGSAAAAQTDALGPSPQTGTFGPSPQTDAPWPSPLTSAGTSEPAVADGEVHIGEGIQIERAPEHPAAPSSAPIEVAPPAPARAAPIEVAPPAAPSTRAAVEPTSGSPAPRSEFGASVPSPPAAPTLEPPTMADAADAVAPAAVSGTTDRANAREVSIDAQPVASNSVGPDARLLMAAGISAATVLVGAGVYRRGRTRRV